ncbi:MAG: redoxin domain-containing protein [Candidatus Scalindua sp.]|nr:redoxin domain-containing protein [Candidatus Scalindua sp.]
MKLQRLTIVLCSFGVLLFCGCKTIQKLPVTHTTDAHTYVKRCSTCHAVPHPSRLKYEHWKDKITVMSGKQMPVITELEKISVLSYINNHSGKGKKLYKLRCGSCHTEPDVERLRPDEWKNQLVVLDGNMPVFSEEERLAVVRYLETYAKRGRFKSEAQSAAIKGLQYPELRKIPPSFSLNDMEGNQFSLRKTEGKAVIVHFWATWCEPCREELSTLQSIWKKFANEDLQIVGIVSCKEREVDVKNFVLDQGVTFPILVDTTGQTYKSYLVKMLPTTYLIGRDGKILARANGAINWENNEIVNYIQEIVQQ